MLDKTNFEILNGFISMILFDVTQKYIDRIKMDGEKPPKLIEDYLDNPIKLLNKYKRNEMLKIKNTIEDVSKKDQKEFKELFKKYEYYQELCQELNFAYLLVIDSELQEKTVALICNNIYEYKILVDKDLIIHEQVSISKVIAQSNTKKINKLHNYNNSSKEPVFV